MRKQIQNRFDHAQPFRLRVKLNCASITLAFTFKIRMLTAQRSAQIIFFLSLSHSLSEYVGALIYHHVLNWAVLLFTYTIQGRRSSSHHKT